MRDIHSSRNSALKKIANKQCTMEDTRMLDSSCLVEHPDNNTCSEWKGSSVWPSMGYEGRYFPDLFRRQKEPR